MSQRGVEKGAKKRGSAKTGAKATTKKKPAPAPRKPGVAKAGKRSKSSSPTEKSIWSKARKAQHEMKREAILRVASRLINRKGYAGMSLTDIAAELGLRNASLYHYFDSKSDLVFSCYERAQQIVSDTLEFVELSRGSGLEAIELYVARMGERMREEGELPLAPNVWALEHAHMKIIFTLELANVQRIAKLIERGVGDGSIRDCDVPLMTTMLSSALRMVPSHYLGVKRATWPRLDEEVLVAVRRLLGAESESITST